MADWFDSVDVFVEVAFGDTPLTPLASRTWVDVTAYARTRQGIVVDRGRRSELSPVGPGTMRVTFDNRTRVFDSSNTAGAYYGQLLPMTPIRYRLVLGATTAYMFTGYVLGWPITYPSMKDSTVTVECVDAFRVLAQSELPGSAYAAEVLADSPAHYWPMQDTTSDVVLALIGGVDADDPSTSTFGPFSSTSIGYPIGEAEGLIGNSSTSIAGGRRGNDTVAIPAAIEMWAGPGVNSGPGSSTRFALSTTDFFGIELHTDHVDINYSHDSQRDSVGTSAGVSIYFGNVPEGDAYHAFVTASATTLTVYVNGTAVGTDTLVAGTYDGSVMAAPFPTVGIFAGYAKGGSHAAAYASAPSAARIKAHWLAGLHPYGHPYGERTGDRLDRILDAIDWPSADRDISTGETYCGNWLPESATALNAARELESAEQGLLFVSGEGEIVFRDRQWFMTNTRAINAQATFDDDGTDIPYNAVAVDGNDIDFIRNHVTVTYPGGTITVKDQTSIDNYLIQSDSVNANAMPSTASWLARQLANFRVRVRKDPATRVPQIAPSMRPVTAAKFAVATLDLGDRVVVNCRPSGGSGSIAANCSLQGIRSHMTGDSWAIDLYLAPAPKSYTEAPYLIAGGSSAYSNVGVASGNLVPF